MKTFKQFITELQAHVPVVSIDRQYVNINDPETIDEINKNLEIEMATGFSDVRKALNKIRKILDMYQLNLEKTDTLPLDGKGGKINLPVNIARVDGVTTNAKIIKDAHKGLVLNVQYKMDNGVYRVTAEVEK
jgi:hypothetical protein